ncbi:MAG: hypothetical protein Hyperionvirus14_36 [Hyperionvirus sp.]|uniref:VWFA domain-containing protein n=1 Tax=Hyperionvirus sp. TaxID=2487770 RepID=A0A3G5A9K6_9VIRU|nr:MAG: hypothetical protein Hyperionvirus14_36 [Hyperionvirus sp.]
MDPYVYANVPATPSAPPLPTPDLSRYNLLVKQYELKADVAEQLKQVLSKCEVVLLCDDSSSMGNAIAEENTDPFAPKRSTRWLELKRLASKIIEFVTAINAEGLDIHFLNRTPILNVTTTTGLQNVFNIAPDGDTPLIGALWNLYRDKASKKRQKELLIIVITDGEPTDASRQDLYNTLIEITKDGITHVSFAECTDQSDDMEYLDAWDGLIRNFDNTDDYREELARVKNIQGFTFKFDYNDYVIKILLATFVRWYFNLDQVRVFDNRYQSTPTPQISRAAITYQPVPNFPPQQIPPTTSCCVIL